MARGEDVVAQIWLTGRGRHSRVEVRGVEAGHLVRFRELKIVEFLAFPTWDLAVEHLEGPASDRRPRSGSGDFSHQGVEVPASGTPFRLCTPRSSNARAEPTTRSFTVEETRISPAEASAAIREPIVTAMPEISLPCGSISPVCSPARISTPWRPIDSLIARRAANRPRRTVERGEDSPSPEALDLPSPEPGKLGAGDPVVLLPEITPPVIPHRRGLRGRVDDVGEHDRRQRQRSNVSCSSRTTMPTKRSTSLIRPRSGRLPTEVTGAGQFRRTRSRRSPGRGSDPAPTGSIASSRGARTSVGTLIAGSSCRMSNSRNTCSWAYSALGLADMRWNRSHHTSMPRRRPGSD